MKRAAQAICLGGPFLFYALCREVLNRLVDSKSSANVLFKKLGNGQNSADCLDIGLSNKKIRGYLGKCKAFATFARPDGYNMKFFLIVCMNCTVWLFFVCTGAVRGVAFIGSITLPDG